MSMGNLIKILNKLLPEIEKLNVNLEQLNKQQVTEEEGHDENRKSYNNGYQNGPKLK